MIASCSSFLKSQSFAPTPRSIRVRFSQRLRTMMMTMQLTTKMRKKKRAMIQMARPRKITLRKLMLKQKVHKRTKIMRKKSTRRRLIVLGSSRWTRTTHAGPTTRS